MTQHLVENALHTLAHFRLYRLKYKIFFFISNTEFGLRPK